jgi:hypothetical protein
MTNEEQKLREIEDILADIFTAGGESHEVGGQSFDQLKQSGYIDRKITDLTALISEHYYPKEFVIWLLNGYTFLKRDQSFVVNYPYLNEHNNYRHFTCDELFSYWKENER